LAELYELAVCLVPEWNGLSGGSFREQAKDRLWPFSASCQSNGNRNVGTQSWRRSGFFRHRQQSIVSGHFQWVICERNFDPFITEE
jgi:hypothetical protein